MELLELIQSLSALDIILFAVGVLLLIVEVCSPGFGVAGVLGIVCLVADIFIAAETVAQGLMMTGIVAVIVVILAVISIVLVSKGKLPASLMLKTAANKALGYTGGADNSAYLGKTGTTVTELRPAGAMDMDGRKLDVVSRGEFIESGTAVEVIEVSGNRIVVKAV